jgi:hypothetical protein
MHKMNETSKVLTIIGLVFEGMACIGFVIGGLVFSVLEIFTLDSLLAEGLTLDEANSVLLIIEIMGGIFIVLATLIFVMFMVNLVVFTKLINGKYTLEQAKNIYIYQVVWGGISIAFNQITGVLYLISGIKGTTISRLVEQENKKIDV